MIQCVFKKNTQIQALLLCLPLFSPCRMCFQYRRDSKAVLKCTIFAQIWIKCDPDILKPTVSNIVKIVSLPKPKTLIQVIGTQYRFWWNLVESIHNQQWLVSFSFHNVTFNLSSYFVPCNTPALQTSSDWLEKVTFLGSHLPNQGLKINLFEHCESIFFILTTSIRYRHITCILWSAFQQWFSFLTKSNCKKL